MLKFTGAGAVAVPEVVQIRVAVRFPARLRAGAPEPTRELSDDEVRDNVRFFTGDRGPRARACTALVLAGVDPAAGRDLAGILDEARGRGVTRVTWHAGAGDLAALAGGALADRVDAVAATVRTVPDAAALAGARWPVTAVVPLEAAVLPGLDALAAALGQARPERVVFTWPFPPADAPPPADVVTPALRAPVAALAAAGVRVGVKGLPPCRLGDLHARAWRSGNRWYVDADHQRDRALLFFPDVVRFAHGDDCRFCRLVADCDGAPEPWLRAGIVGRLVPVD